MRVEDGFLVMSKRQHTNNEGAEALISPEAVAAVEPHRTGCFVYAGGQRWDVAHSHAEIIGTINAALGRTAPRMISGRAGAA